MPQLHLHVSEPVAKALRERAEAEGREFSLVAGLEIEDWEVETV